MDLLNRYFSKLKFQYVEEKQGYAVYAAALYSLLGGNNCRFVILFVPAHLGVQSSAKISELPWQNLQTRTCPKNTYNVRPQDWVFPNTLPNINFVVSSRNKQYTTYTSDDPSFDFQVSMVHSPKKASLYQYPNNMQLHWAIDQFNTVFNYIGKTQPIQMTQLPPLQFQEPIEIKPPSAMNPLAGWFTSTSATDLSDTKNFELIK